MKKVIGVLPLWDDEKNSLWMLPGYLEGITAAGGLPFVLPLTVENSDIRQLCGMCGGFLFTGGHDVCPSLYGEKPLNHSVVSCRKRDMMEQEVLSYALETGKPLLGICRGIQFLNAALGGTLYQDLPLQHPSAIDHHMSPPYDRTCHLVHLVKDSPLYQLLGLQTLGVNSYHHQAIREVAPSLTVMAVSEDDLVEAVCMKDQKFVWAVQWHPEFSYRSDEYSQKIFDAFVGHC